MSASSDENDMGGDMRKHMIAQLQQEDVSPHEKPKIPKEYNKKSYQFAVICLWETCCEMGYTEYADELKDIINNNRFGIFLKVHDRKHLKVLFDRLYNAYLLHNSGIKILHAIFAKKCECCRIMKEVIPYSSKFAQNTLPFAIIQTISVCCVYNHIKHRNVFYQIFDKMEFDKIQHKDAITIMNRFCHDPYNTILLDKVFVQK